MISLKGITKTYRMKSGEVHALKGVSLDLPENGMVFVLGKSGCGKSTLLNIVGGLDEITSGEIVVDGVSMSEYRAKDYDMYRNRYIGFIFQEYNLIDGFNVGKNISLALELQQNKYKNKLIAKALEQVGLAGYYNRKTNELSGGQKQRVAIARALVKNPRIILADEPTGNLDSATAEEIFGLLKELSRDRLILVVSHDRENAEQYADRIIELKDGEVLSDRVINAVSKTQSSLATVGNDNGKGIASDGEESDAANSTQQQKTELGTENVSKSNRKQRISGNMPFTSALSYAFINLWHKKFRVLASILLFIISLSLFNFAYATSRYNVYDTAYKTFEDAGYSYVNLQAQYVNKNYNFVADEFGEEAVPIYADYSNIVKYSDISLNQESGYFNDRFICSMPINNKIMENMGFNVLHGRLPSKSTEICISKYSAESILNIGKLHWDMVGVNSIEGLINRVVDKREIFTVVGIIDTKFPARYDELKEKTSEEIISMNNNLSKSFEEQTNKTAHVSIMCHESYYDDFYVPQGKQFYYNAPFERRMDGYSANILDELGIDYYKIADIDDGVILSYSDAKEFATRAGLSAELKNYTFDTILELFNSYEIKAELTYDRYHPYAFSDRIIGVYDSSKNINAVGKIFLSGSARTQLNDNVPCVQAILVDMDNKVAVNRAIEISSLVQQELEFAFNNDVNYELESTKKNAMQYQVIGAAGAAVFAVIVAILLLNYFMSTIKDNNKEIGVLRALGVKNSNVISIYLLEAVIISIFAFIVSIPIAFSISNWLESIAMNTNPYGYDTFIHFIDMGIVSCLVTLALCIGIALIGCIAPFAKLFRRKPMEIIRKQ